MTETSKNPFSKTCKWCDGPRKTLPSGVLICTKCDKNDDTIIPNETGLIT